MDSQQGSGTDPPSKTEDGAPCVSLLLFKFYVLSGTSTEPTAISPLGLASYQGQVVPS